MTAALPALHQLDGEPVSMLDGLANLINEAAAEHMLAGRRSLECARRAGVYLLQAKRHLGHGKFRDFVVARCGFSHETACRYMKVAAIDQAKFVTMTNLTIAEALRMAASEAEPPPPPRDEAQGEIFTALDAPTPTDAASRLLTAGMSIDRESDNAHGVRLLVQRLDREQPWKLKPEALVDEMSSETLGALERVAEPMILWLRNLLEATKGERELRRQLMAMDRRIEALRPPSG